jgi:acetyl esterase/lipase
VALEQGAALARPLPSFFLPCGTWDVLLDDTHRLARALERSGHKSTEAREYLRGPHAFHAFVFTRAARACWRDTFDFLARAGVAPR